MRFSVRYIKHYYQGEVYDCHPEVGSSMLPVDKRIFLLTKTPHFNVKTVRHPNFF